MRAWWLGLSGRERAMVAGAGLFLLGCCLYFLGVAPFVEQLSRYRREVPEQRALLAWMHDAAKEVESLRPAAGVAAKSGGSVMVVIDQTAKQFELGKKLKRIEPEGENGAKVWLEDAAYEDVLRWLHRLADNHGIRVLSFAAEPVERGGYVKARITLAGGGT